MTNLGFILILSVMSSAKTTREQLFVLMTLAAFGAIMEVRKLL